jgi:hypothetical protein
MHELRIPNIEMIDRASIRRARIVPFGFCFAVFCFAVSLLDGPQRPVNRFRSGDRRRPIASLAHQIWANIQSRFPENGNRFCDLHPIRGSDRPEIASNLYHL